MPDDRLIMRRDLLRRGVVLGGLTAGAAGLPALLAVGRASAAAGDDAQVLEGAIRLEQTAVLAYATMARSPRLVPAVARVARDFRRQDQRHADALITALARLGGTPPAKPTHVPGLPAALAGGQTAMLRFALALEEVAVGTYHDASRRLDDSKLLQTAVSIMANQGQHLVVLRRTLGEDPVPSAFATGRAV
jgi:rubrerythrin